MSGRFYLGRDRVVQAGAGTGKTYALITQYLHLCAGLTAHGTLVPPRAICALTFTEKAASEMRERLQRRVLGIIRQLAAATSDESLATLLLPSEPDLVQSAEALGRPLPGLAHWEKVLSQLGSAPLSTFHSFFATLLRRYAGVAGLDPDFSLLDEDTTQSLLQETSERVVLTALEGGDQPGLPGSPQAVDATAQLLSEYGFSGGASADGGLCEALGRLHRNLAEEGKHAAGLADGYRDEGLQAELARIRSEVLAGLAALQRLGTRLTGKSAERTAELSTLADSLSFLLQSLQSLPQALPQLAVLTSGLGALRSPRSDQSDPGLRDELAQLKTQLKAVVAEASALWFSVRAQPLALALEQLLEPLRQSFTQAKRDLGALDFADLLICTRDLLRDHPDVRAEAQARFTVFLVDEFQDTNPLQAELLQLLVGSSLSPGDDFAPAPQVGRLYLVGDRKQSIYQFRGADVAAYTQLCARLVAEQADEETLYRSYRSRPPVLQFVSELFSRLMQPPASSASTPTAAPAWFVRWDAQRDPLAAVRPVDPKLAEPAVQLVRSRPVPPPEPDPTATSLPVTPPPVAPSAIEREAQLVAARCTALREAGQPLRDIVVLLRRFTHLAHYTQALKRAGVPFYVVRGRGFYQAQEVLDVTALLTVLDDPEDRLALLTLLRSPLCGLSDDSLVRLHLAGRLSLAALLSQHASEVAAAAAPVPSPIDPRDVPPRDYGEEDFDDAPPLELLDGPPPVGEAGSDGAPPPLASSLSPSSATLAVLPSDEQGRLTRLLGLLQLLLRCGDRLGPATCLQALCDQTDYLAVLAADPDGEQRIANVYRLMSRARALEGRGGLRSFVRTLRLCTDPQFAAMLGNGSSEPAAQLAGESDDVVRIMTVHQSKGLEFPIVLLAGCTTRERHDAPVISYDRELGLGLCIYENGERESTLAALRIGKQARLRAEAESARLFYVAVTRASERVCFFGEASSPSRVSGTWRAHLDSLLAEAPLTESASAPPLLSVWEPPLTESLPPPVAPQSPPALRRAAELAVQAVYTQAGGLLPGGGPAYAKLRLPSAQVADLLLCPRRYHLLFKLRLTSPWPPARALLSEEARQQSLQPGPQHHSALYGRLLAALPLSSDPTLPTTTGGLADLLAAQLGLLSLDPETPTATEVIARLTRFLQTPFVRRELLTQPQLQRAVAYAVPLLESLQVEGLLDAVYLSDAAEAVVTVLDYHGSAAPEPAPEAERAPRPRWASALPAQPSALLGQEGLLLTSRRVLLAAAALALYPQATRARVGLCYLRDPDPSPRFVELDRSVLQALLAGLQEALQEAAGAATLTPAAALRLPVLPAPTCRAHGCEYQPLCHPAP